MSRFHIDVRLHDIQSERDGYRSLPGIDTPRNKPGRSRFFSPTYRVRGVCEVCKTIPTMVQAPKDQPLAYSVIAISLSVSGLCYLTQMRGIVCALAKWSCNVEVGAGMGIFLSAR